MEAVASVGEGVHQAVAARLETHYRLRSNPSVWDITPLYFERADARADREFDNIYTRGWDDDLPMIRPQRKRERVAFRLGGDAQVPLGYQILPRQPGRAGDPLIEPVQQRNLNKIRFRGLKQTVA